MNVVAFGGTDHARLEIHVAGYERTQTVGEYFDDNWLLVRVSVSAGGFRGTYDATFQVAELCSLRDELVKLHSTLQGSATLQTMEGQLLLRFQGNGLGKIKLYGEAVDQPGTGNRLIFNLSLDQTQLADSLHDLNEAIETFPIRAA